MDYGKIYGKDYFSGKNSFFYRLGYGKMPFLFDSQFKPIKKYAENIKSGNVLDIGCAYGFMLERFPYSFKRFGLDVSEYAIKIAEKRLSDAVLKVGDAQDKIPFKSNLFDIVLMNDVLEHLENPEAALRNTKKVLRKGGMLYITTPNLNAVRRAFFKIPDKREHHISMFKHSDLIRLLEFLGYEILEGWTFINLGKHIDFKSEIGTESAIICRK